MDDPKPELSTKRGQPKITDAMLEPIYQAYPRRVGKQAAIKAIRKAIVQLERSLTREQAFEKLMAAVKAFAAARAGEDQKFTPHPATWFNRGSWEDDPAAWTAKNALPKPWVSDPIEVAAMEKRVAEAKKRDGW